MKREMTGIRQGHYYLVWFCVGFISGIFLWLVSLCLENIPFSVLWGYSFMSMLITAVVILLIPGLTGKKLMTFADRVLILVIFTGLIAGSYRAYYEDNIKYRTLEDTFGTEYTYMGYVISEPKPSSTGRTNGFTVNVTGAEGKDEEIKLSGKVYIHIDNSLDINRGNMIKFTTAFSKPADASFRGGFSYRNKLYKDGCRASGYVPDIEKTGEKFEGFSFSYWLHTIGLSVQNGVLNSMDKYIGDYQEENALIKGILFGNKDNFSTVQYNSFASSGLIHITAASGMHVSFLCGFIIYLLRHLRIKRKLAYLMTVPFLILFAAAADFTPSILRAVIMTGVYILACLIQRQAHSLTSLGLSALVLLFTNPYIITDYGFILSFSAVLGIIIFYRPLQSRIKSSSLKEFKGNKAADWIIDSICVSLSGSIGLGYFLARFFNRISWAGIVGNIIAVPLGAISFIGGIVVWAMDFVFPFIAEVIAEYPVRYALFAMNRIAEFFALPFFNMYIPTLPYSFFPIYVMICCAIYYCLSHKTLTLYEE